MTKTIKLNYWYLLLLAAYAYSCLLMARIIGQYIPVGTDTAFLNIKQDYINLPYYLPAFYIHVFTALLALPAGFTQFSLFVQQRYAAIHRLNGRIYAYSILLLGGPSGFIIGLYANGGLPSQISFCLLAILWMFFTYKAVHYAVQGRIKEHKWYMYRSFALTLSAITLRAWKYILVILFHPHPMDVYRIIAWLGWTLNLIAAEYFIFKQRKT